MNSRPTTSDLFVVSYEQIQLNKTYKTVTLDAISILYDYENKREREKKSTFKGLPQERNLGPVILLFFAKDMSKKITVGRTWTLADDVSHLITENNLEEPTRCNLNEQINGVRKTNFCLIVIKPTLCFF